MRLDYRFKSSFDVWKGVVLLSAYAAALGSDRTSSRFQNMRPRLVGLILRHGVLSGRHARSLN